MKPNPQEHQAARDKAILQFREWRNRKFACLDTETTGLEGYVWQFALINQANRIPLLTFDCRVLGVEWSEKALKMRLAQERYVGAADPEAAYFAPVVEHMLTYRPVLMWNADFDIAAVERTWPNAGTDLRQFGACAMKAYAPIFGEWSESRQDWKYCSLDRALEREQVHEALRSGLAPAHSAYGDACRLALLVEAVAELETSSEQAEWEIREDQEFYGDGLESP